MSISDLSNDDDEVEVTSRTYLIRIFIAVILIIISFKYALNSWEDNKFLFLLALFSLIFLLFELNCIDISIVENSKIKLYRFEKIIAYSRIEKIGILPIYSRALGAIYSVCYIKYYDSDNKKKHAFFYVNQKKMSLFEELQKIISKNNSNSQN